MCLIAGLARSLSVLRPLCTLVVHSKGFAGVDLKLFARSSRTSELPHLCVSKSPNKPCWNVYLQYNGHPEPCQVGVFHLRPNPNASHHGSTSQHFNRVKRVVAEVKNNFQTKVSPDTLTKPAIEIHEAGEVNYCIALPRGNKL